MGSSDALANCATDFGTSAVLWFAARPSIARRLFLIELPLVGAFLPPEHYLDCLA